MSSPRLASVDLLRGLVIVAMALDHTRDFFQPAGASPEDFHTTTWPFFLTRWVTHFCAPVFVFLAGFSAGLGRGDTPGRARHLVTRGLWLMLLEITWVNAAWQLPHVTYLHLGVLWAIGGAMVLLAPCLWLPRRGVLALGVVITLALAAVEVPADVWWGFFLRPGPHPLGDLHVQSTYVIVPWFAVLACGYGVADLLADATGRRRLAAIGVGLTAAFVGLRATEAFGDPVGWSAAAQPAMAFLNASKYPPSLVYQLMTLGPALALLPLLDAWRGPLRDAVLVFGRVPLFFYLLHLPLIHLAGIAHARWRYGQDHIPAGEPLSLPLVWGAWLLLVLALWPLCRAYDRQKTHARVWWMGWL